MRSEQKDRVHKRGSWYQRLVAHVMATGFDGYNATVASRKQALIGALRGRVVEIGAGTGANFAHFAPGVRWLGIEPNPAMFPYAEHKAKLSGMHTALCEGTAEALPLASASVDAVVSTTVLCSVRDPRLALREVLRVLKPGGQFVFIEHVAAPHQTRLRRVQRVVSPVWQCYAAGCRPDQETWALIEQAGFSRVEIEHFKLDITLVGPHIAGVAVK